MKESARRLLLLAGIVVAVYAVGTWLRGYLGIEFSAESIRDYVLDLGPLAPIFFVFIVAGRSMLGLPSQVVLIAAGLCFGTWLGALVGGAGRATPLSEKSRHDDSRRPGRRRRSLRGDRPGGRRRGKRR